MAEPKAQLVAPVGNINLPGMNATGVITATFSGTGGVVTNLTGSPDLDVGIVTGSSFIGDGTGHAASLTGTPELNLGITTATSFVGDAVGKAAGLTGTPNLNVGLITGTSFVGFVTGNVTGNISGLAGSVTPGVNLGVGVCTALELYGDGSALTGAGSSASIAQEINANAGAETIIDLSDGNLIYYDGNSNATVGFASTSAAEQITFIRKTGGSYSTSYATGAVDLDGTDDALTLGATTDLELDGDFTIEWSSIRDATGGMDAFGIGAYQVLGGMEMFFHSADYKVHIYTTDGSGGANRLISASTFAIDEWQHYALVRSGSTITLYFDGKSQGSWSSSLTLGPSGNNIFKIGCGQATAGAALITFWDGKISNFRVVKGTAVYTGDFIPPRKQLENVTNTKLLCCQDTSSATAATVTPGTITAESSPTAAAQTITGSGTFNGTRSITWPDSVKWNNNTAPTLIDSSKSTSLQLFHFTTVDTGATYNAWEEMGYDADFTTGRVFVWGRNKFGSLGQNQANSQLGQVSSPIQVGTEETWTSVGYRKGVKSDGTLWIWGENNWGDGLNDRTNRSSPTQVGTDSTWSSVNAGGWFKTDGSLWVVGYNGTGNLGQNNLTAYSSPVQIPGTTWTTKIAAGNQHKIAIKSDGTLWGWGDQSDRGQLGQNSRAAISSPMQIGAGTDWSKVWNSPGGGYGSHAIKTDGTLWVWGNNYGALGLNENNGSRSSPTQLPGTNWKQTSMANSANSAYAVKTDGTLWSWGRNADYGNLGLNDIVNYSSPMQIGTDTDWSEPLAGAVGEVGALKTDDTLWMWGDSSYGGSGLNSNVKHSSPTQLPGKWVNIQGDGASSFTALRYSS